MRKKVDWLELKIKQKRLATFDQHKLRTTQKMKPKKDNNQMVAIEAVL